MRFQCALPTEMKYETVDFTEMHIKLIYLCSIQTLLECFVIFLFSIPRVVFHAATCCARRFSALSARLTRHTRFGMNANVFTGKHTIDLAFKSTRHILVVEIFTSIVLIHDNLMFFRVQLFN